MTVKIILVGLTLVLLINEHFQFIDKFDTKLKRKALLIIFGLVTIFSIIDVYNDNEDFNRLEKKSKDIFDKSEEILNRVDKAVSGIDETQSKLVSLDSFAVQTNILLDSALKKSNELVRLEKLRFSIEEPNIIPIAGNIKFQIENDTIKLISYSFENSGKRKAIKVSYSGVLVFFNYDTNKIMLIKTSDGKDYFENKYSVDIPGNNTNPVTSSIRVNFPTSRISNLKSIIFGVYKFSYKDSATLKGKEENYFFASEDFKAGTFEHHNLSEIQKEAIIEFLVEKKMDRFITSENNKKYLKK